MVRNGHDEGRGGDWNPGAAPSTDEVVGGRRTLPPGSGTNRSKKRTFVNPYIARIDEYPDLVLRGPDAEGRRGNWCDEDRPPYDRVELEIGSGNGFFLREACLRDPARLLVGLELRYKRVWMAARKLHRAGCVNGKVVLHHAGYLHRLFAGEELDGIHIYHPDPWPKDRHARNRLFTDRFTAVCAELLRPCGLVHIKSDFPPHAEAARASFERAGLTLDAFTDDLHRPNEPLADGNIVTNYERKAIEAGRPVFLMRLRKSG